MTLIFDASALIALVRSEPGSGVVSGLLADRSQTQLVHAVNLCEVYYVFERDSLPGDLDELVAGFRSVGLKTRDDLDEPFWRLVAGLKVAISPASLADCFALALARRTGGTVVTADQPGFLPAQALAVCEVMLIR